MSRGNKKASNKGSASGLPSVPTVAVDAVPAFPTLSYAERQAMRVELIEKLSLGGSRDDATSWSGALRGLKDYEAAERAQELPARLDAMEGRLDDLEEAQSGAKGFAQRADSAVTPPLRPGEPAN